MTSKHPLRRSCAFCRARKIKCSNETICEACRRQGADCIYDFEPPRSSCRAASQESCRSEGSARPDGSSSRKRPHTGGTSSRDCSTTTAPEELKAPGNVGNLAQILEQRFYENLSRGSISHLARWQGNNSAYHCQPCEISDHESPKHANITSYSNHFKHTGILSSLSNDLLGLVTHQFGSLGSHHIEEGGAQFFAFGLANDDAQTMFDDSPLGGNPLSEYGQRQQTQLIDVWFSVHPLSFLVSKTLLLRELRDGTHDEMLLAVMLADANLSMDEEVATARGHILLRWAIAQLRRRFLRPNSFSSSAGPHYSGISTRVFHELPTAQALMLLAWNALRCSQIRRAKCYVGLAGHIATDIQDQMLSNKPLAITSSRINGIDVLDVEKEVVSYLFWITYSLNLWAGVQTKSSDASSRSPPRLAPVFLPVTEASSVIIQLDVISENFSTLQKQKSVIREMWPLAQIASIVSYIYALHPCRGYDAEVPQISSWQKEQSPALRHTQQEKTVQDVASVYTEIRRVLRESIHFLDRQVAEVPSKVLALVAHHTMTIHFLFPISLCGQVGRGPPSDAIEQLCASADEILQIFASISQYPQDLFSTTPVLLSAVPDILCLALDTCARAISYVAAKRNSIALPDDLPVTTIDDDRLRLLALDLYTMSKNDLLNQGNRLKTIRRQLRSCHRNFGGSQAGSTSSGMASPDDSSRSGTSSPRSFPHPSPPLESSVGPNGLSAFGPSNSFSSPTGTMTIGPSFSSMPSSDFPVRQNAAFASKPEWVATDDFIHCALEPGILTSPTTNDHYSMSGLVEMNHVFYAQTPGVMDVDPSGAMIGVKWDWPDIGVDATAAAAAASADLDSFMYYDDVGHK